MTGFKLEKIGIYVVREDVGRGRTQEDGRRAYRVCGIASNVAVGTRQLAISSLARLLLAVVARAPQWWWTKSSGGIGGGSNGDGI